MNRIYQLAEIGPLKLTKIVFAEETELFGIDPMPEPVKVVEQPVVFGPPVYAQKVVSIFTQVVVEAILGRRGLKQVRSLFTIKSWPNFRQIVNRGLLNQAKLASTRASCPTDTAIEGYFRVISHDRSKAVAFRLDSSSKIVGNTATQQIGWVCSDFTLIENYKNHSMLADQRFSYDSAA